MHKIIIAAALAVALAVLPGSADAAYLCLNADQFTIPAGSTCSKLPVTATGGALAGAGTVITCTNSGNNGVAFADIPALPSDWPESAGVLNTQSAFVDWIKGDASSGNGCWRYGLRATISGQDFAADTLITNLVAAVTLPSGTNLETSTRTTDDAVLDATGANCDASCRLMMLRVGVGRNNASCASNANGTISFTKWCFEY